MRHTIIKITWALSILLNILLIILLVRIIPTQESSKYVVQEFSLTDYAWGIENFPIDGNVGVIHDANTAVEKAKELWLKEFSTIGGKPYNPINDEPIEVYYNESADCWLVNGTLPPEVAGAVPTAIFTSSGEVVAVWMN